MNKKTERKLELLYDRLQSYEHLLKNAKIPDAAKTYAESIRRVKREIARLEGRGETNEV
jgi:hypothetical protein